MNWEIISFRMDTEKKDAFDAIAPALGRDRSEIQRWQLDHINEGIRQADVGEFASKAQVKAAFARLRK